MFGNVFRNVGSSVTIQKGTLRAHIFIITEKMTEFFSIPHYHIYYLTCNHDHTNYNEMF